jgi:NADPH:quinone reductase-like Zn-dependent oxidoreductase
MKAICLRARGGPEALAYEEAPQPHPGEGEVLVRVHAAGVIHTELSWVPTWTTQAGEPRPLPLIPGHEFSGEIAALGAGVSDVGVGTWCTDSMTGTGTAPRPNTAWRASPISPTSRPASITFTQPPHRFPL